MASMAFQQPGNGAQAYKEGEPLAKRRRVALACSACRARKSRSVRPPYECRWPARRCAERTTFADAMGGARPAQHAHLSQ